MAACVKALGQDIPAGQTIFLRGLVSIAMLAAIAWRMNDFSLLVAKDWRSHALRSLCGTGSMFGFFAALTLMPLADVTAISFTAPMFLTVLAMLFLGERIHRYRWTALIAGLLGVLIMIGPHLAFSDQNSLGVGIALMSALLSAVAMMFLRGMSGGEHAITITFYFSITSSLCAALTAFWGWPMPTLQQWLFIAGASVMGGVGQLAMTYSYRYAEASTLAPLDYTNMVMAVLLGYFFFGEVPGLSIWMGAPLIIAAGLVIFWREYTLHKSLSTGAA